ncbi:MAG TPA: alanine racemase, partial [Chitinivibrionales bacterium]
NLNYNIDQIRRAFPSSVGIMAVVKDNAYGCGSVMVSRCLEERGVAFFAVARVSEARTLRDGGIVSPILILGETDAEGLRWGAGANIRFSLTDLSDISLWKICGCPVRFHADIDTGMGRIGLQPCETAALIDAVRGDSNLMFEGMYTHLANADAEDAGPTQRQIALFRSVRAGLALAGLKPAILHYGNSAGLMRFPQEECTLARPGISLYGCNPDPTRSFPLLLKPVMGLKGRVVKVKRVGPGTAVSYGSTYVTSSETVIATIGIGYGQGVPRFLSNRGSVLIRGSRFQIAGRVTMDYLMVDAGATSPLSVGDEGCVMGCQGTQCIAPDEVALLGNTIGYEIMCSVSSTIDRYYLLEGKAVRFEPARPF